MRVLSLVLLSAWAALCLAQMSPPSSGGNPPPPPPPPSSGGNPPPPPTPSDDGHHRPFPHRRPAGWPEALYCLNDIDRECASEKKEVDTKGPLELMACLYRKRAHLSESCKSAIGSSVPFMCAEDAWKYCKRTSTSTTAGPQDERRRLFQCMREHHDDLSTECKNSIRDSFPFHGGPRHHDRPHRNHDGPHFRHHHGHDHDNNGNNNGNNNDDNNNDDNNDDNDNGDDNYNGSNSNGDDNGDDYHHHRHHHMGKAARILTVVVGVVGVILVLGVVFRWRRRRRAMLRAQQNQFPMVAVVAPSAPPASAPIMYAPVSSQADV